MSDKGLKKAVCIGAAIGAVFSLLTALSMDMLMSGTVQGTWWDAAANDVARLFGPKCGENPVAIGLMLAFVMAFLAGFGALLGAAAGAIMNRFFKNILKL